MFSTARRRAPAARAPRDRARERTFDGPPSQVGLAHEASNPADGVAGDREAVDPDPPLFRDEPSRDGIQERAALLRVARYHQGDLAARETCADTVEEPTTARSGSADAEQLDHAGIFGADRYGLMTDA